MLLGGLPLRLLRLDLIQCTADTSAHGSPVDPHVLRHCASRKIYGQPAYSKIEVFGESAVMIRPGHSCYQNTVFRAFHSMSVGLDLDECSAPVQPALLAGQYGLRIILRTASAANRAVIFMPAVWSGMYSQVVDPILIGIKVMASYDCALDIEQLFT